MATTAAIERMARTAKEAGCPQDQLENFLSAGYVPQPKQLQFHAAARQADKPDMADEIGVGGARGGGKSHTILAQMLLDDARRIPGFKGLYLRKIGKQAREQFDDLRRRMLGKVPHEFNRSSGVVNLWNDSRIFIGHFQNESDIDNYLGIEYDEIAIEEATTLSLAKYRALRDSNRTSKTGWRPRIYNSTNPGGLGHAWYRQKFILPYRSGTETLTRFIPATIDDNRLIDPDYKRKLEENTGWKLRAYRYGDWDIAAGQFFSTFRHDTHVIKPFAIPAEWRKWAAMDYGYTHPTVAGVAAQDGDGNIYVMGMHSQSKWLPQQHATAIKELLKRLGLDLSDLRTFVAGADVFAKRGTTTATIADLYKDEGIRLKPARDDRISGAGHLMNLLGDVDRGITPKLFIFDTCVDLIECLPAMEHDPHRPEDVLKVDVDEDGNGGDDAYDFLRYLCLSVQGGSQMG